MIYMETTTSGMQQVAEEPDQPRDHVVKITPSNICCPLTPVSNNNKSHKNNLEREEGGIKA